MTASGRGSRRVMRRKPLADSTEEVQVEDILLEAYAEDPPPPLTRRSAGAPPLPPDTESARASIAMAIASAVPPPAQSAAVDALLRASAPAFTPYPLLPSAPSMPLQGQGFVHPQDYYRHSGADFESQSVAPVMLASTVPPPARPVFANGRGRVSRSAVVAIWSTVLVVIGVALGAAVVLGMKNGTYARLRDSAKSAAVRGPSKPAAVAAAPERAPAPAPAPLAAPSPVPDRVVVAAAAPAPAAVPVEALAAPSIAADSSLVTFPAYAQGHRVFIDGRLVTPALADGTPTMLKCGRHMVKIGSARKARVLDFACGREVIVK